MGRWDCQLGNWQWWEDSHATWFKLCLELSLPWLESAPSPQVTTSTWVESHTSPPPPVPQLCAEKWGWCWIVHMFWDSHSNFLNVHHHHPPPLWQASVQNMLTSSFLLFSPCDLILVKTKETPLHFMVMAGWSCTWKTLKKYLSQGFVSELLVDLSLFSPPHFSSAFQLFLSLPLAIFP